jgi:hypothetical protein
MNYKRHLDRIRAFNDWCVKNEEPSGYAISDSDGYYVDFKEDASGAYSLGVSLSPPELLDENTANIRLGRIMEDAARQACQTADCKNALHFPLKVTPLWIPRVMA